MPLPMKRHLQSTQMAPHPIDLTETPMRVLLVDGNAMHLEAGGVDETPPSII